jgi:cytochrome c oxidase assembly protein subunit 15
MGDKRFTPVEYWEHEPAWKNFFENPAAVQFNHRVLAMSTYTVATAYYLWARRQPLTGQPRVALHALIAMANVQVALGIATLLYYVVLTSFDSFLLPFTYLLRQPTPLAATHQAGSLTLLSFSLWLSMLARRLPKLPA